MAFIIGAPPIPQDLQYLQFADQRTFWGIPRFWDFISNIPFLITGIVGMAFVAKHKKSFAFAYETRCYFSFFFFVFLTALGSSYFHLEPNIERLFWDRLPISLAFMALMVGVVSDRTDPQWGALLIPLSLLAGSSVLYWLLGEQKGHGDLRFYYLVQFGSLLLLPFLMVMYPSRYPGDSWLWYSFGAYLVAKVFEVSDLRVFEFTGFWSGHTMKHWIAGLGTYLIVPLLKMRVPKKSAQ